MIDAAITYNLKKRMNYKEKKIKVLGMDMLQEDNPGVIKISLRFMNRVFSKKYFPQLINKKALQFLWSRKVKSYSDEYN